MQLGSQSSGAVPFQWDGLNDAGQLVADGSYQFSATAQLGGVKSSAATLSYGVVNSVMQGTQGATLYVGEIGEVSLHRSNKFCKQAQHWPRRQWRRYQHKGEQHGLSTGIEWIKRSGEKSDVIGNNVSNANTVGFKGSQAQFADVVCPTPREAPRVRRSASASGWRRWRSNLGRGISPPHSNPLDWRSAARVSTRWITMARLPTAATASFRWTRTALSSMRRGTN